MRFAIALLAAPWLQVVAATAVSLKQDLSSLPEESIRAALERTLAPKYQEGVFEHGEEAVEAIHNTDPDLAAQVVDAAKQELLQKPELVKRQTTLNITVTTVTESSAVISVVTSTATVISEVPLPESTSRTNVPASTPIVEQSATSLAVPTQEPNPTPTSVPQGSAVGPGITTSAVVSVTTTNAQGSVITSSSTVPAVILSSTDAAGNVRSTTSPITSSRSTTSSSPSSRSIAVVTVFPGGETSEIVVQTDTGADGQRRTITSYKQVAPSTTAGGSGSPSATLAAGLAAATAQIVPELIALVCGVLGLAAFI